MKTDQTQNTLFGEKNHCFLEEEIIGFLDNNTGSVFIYYILHGCKT